MADLTAEFVDKILALSPIETFDYHDLIYTSKPVHLVAPPQIAKVNVITLTALSSLYHSNFEGISGTESVFHVTSEVGVEVYGNHSNDFGQREVWAKASFADIQAFRFNEWHEQEKFIIGLQAHFLDSEDRTYALKLASALATNDKLEVTDDGLTQGVTAKAGITRLENLEVKPRVSLIPYRTFREIEQPVSEFVLRIRKGQNGMPQLALFEADGGSWKLEAMKRIADYLKNATASSNATVIY